MNRTTGLGGAEGAAEPTSGGTEGWHNSTPTETDETAGTDGAGSDADGSNETGQPQDGDATTDGQHERTDGQHDGG
jgi:hypothetical protein